MITGLEMPLTYTSECEFINGFVIIVLRVIAYYQ